MPNRTDEGLRRDVGFFGLLWFSAGTTLGSGWLFGAFVAVTIAGPAALVGWVLAALFMAPLALVYAELGAMFPESGGPGRFAHHAFGSLAGATFGWFAYVQAATIAPIEVLAAIEYLSTNSWASGLYHSGTGTLSGSGYAVAVVLMGVFVTLNLLGIRLLTRANSAITVFKLAIPSLTAVALIVAGFHVHNFTAAGGFFVHSGSGPTQAILSAITAGGIAFALMGFEGALQVGGESAHPQRDLPRAVFGAFLVCTTIYIAVQVAFIGALPPALLAHYTSWTGLATDPQLSRAPFFALASLIGLVWLAWIMRVDAVVSPSGTALVYLTGASRLAFGLSKDGYVPRLFLVEDERTDVPFWGVVMSGALGLLFLLPFPSWSKLVSVVTGAVVLMYAGAPLALGSLRRTRPRGGTALPTSCGRPPRPGVLRLRHLYRLLVGLADHFDVDDRPSSGLWTHGLGPLTSLGLRAAPDRLAFRVVALSPTSGASRSSRTSATSATAASWEGLAPSKTCSSADAV